jgi:hypothetical protein
VNEDLQRIDLKRAFLSKAKNALVHFFKKIVVGKNCKQRKALAAQGFSDMENRGLEPLTSTLPVKREVLLHSEFCTQMLE